MKFSPSNAGRRVAAAILAPTLWMAGPAVQAEYNANMVGKVVEVLTYDNPQVLFRLSNQPATHPACTAYYFALDAAIPADSRKQMLARLLTAYTSGEQVNIGYDATGNCSTSWIRVHRVG